MFSSELVHYDEFTPSGKDCRDTCHTSVQTEPRDTKEAGVQGRQCCDAEAQASPEVVAAVEPRAYDWPSLATFMRQAYPRMKQELERASRSSAFRGYTLLADTREGSVSRLYRDGALPRELHCTDASWNSTGSIVAFSTCGVANHEEWCTHEAGVRLWNPHRSSDSDQAGKLLSTDTCVTSVGFHPQKPSVVVAGTVHGDVLMWDVEAANEQWASSPVVMHDNHQDMVKGIEWIGDTHDTHCLLSCGLDGLIIQWSHDTRKNNLEASNYYLLLAENVRLHKKTISGTTTPYIGVTSLAKNHFDHSVFVMGTEGGGVLQGSLSLSKPIAPVVEGHASVERTYSCPVVASFPPHRGHTLDVHSSPFERNVFASAGIDREVKVFSLLQMEAVLTVQLPESVTRVRWSPSQPTLFAALQGDGRLVFYDIRRTTTPVAEFAPDNPNAMGTSLEFCTRSHDLLFAGRGPGAAQVWQLGSKLVAASEANQRDIIRSVANGSFVPD